MTFVDAIFPLLAFGAILYAVWRYIGRPILDRL